MRLSSTCRCCTGARQRLVAARTWLTNQLRAVLLKRGVILPKRRAPLKLRLDELMAGELAISSRALRLLEDLRDEWASLDRRIGTDELAVLSREDEMARRLATIPGIGAINATALLAAVGDASAFAKGAATSPQGSGLRLDSTPPAARPSSWGSASGATSTCERS